MDIPRAELLDLVLAAFDAGEVLRARATAAAIRAQIRYVLWVRPAVGIQLQIDK